MDGQWGKRMLQTGMLGVALALAGLGAAWADEATTAAGTLSTQTATMDSLAAKQEPSRVSSRFASDFATWAGSQENAEALITGLRGGTPITLTSVSSAGAVTTTTITPPTAPMGYGNTYISLSLAKAQLAQYGITDPTPQELQAALTGGSITVSRVAADGTATTQTVTLDGILTQRAAGMGWGEIAKANGFKLGPVISGMKSANRALAATGAAARPVTTAAGGARLVEKGAAIDKGTAAARGHAYGHGVTTALSGGGVVYGKSVRTEPRLAAAGGNANGLSKAQGLASAAGAHGGVTSAAGANPGNSGNAPGHTKTR